MSGYRLSLLRRRGWIRLGLVGAVGMVPITLMQHALGFFGFGDQALNQTLEYLGAGIILWLIVGFCATWVVHGFAMRSKAIDEDRDEPRSSALPAGRASQGLSPHVPERNPRR
jgi:hypothetical protein